MSDTNAPRPVQLTPSSVWMIMIVILAISAVLGFAVVTRYQLNAGQLGLWDAICRGLGIPSGGLKQASPQTSTNLAWSADTLAQIRAGDAKHGEFVALNCAACHQNPRENLALVVPRLDRLDAFTIYKQLEDYRNGTRSWGVMSAIAKALSRQDSADVAAFYGNHRNGPKSALVNFAERDFSQTDPARRLVFIGDPKRGIAPCAACHGPMGFKHGAPDLRGQRTAYVERQLAAFAQESRKNDVYATMRMIARELTEGERRELAQYYGSQTPD